MHPALVIKPVDTRNGETKRIYEYAERTVSGFNAYIADFFESIAITNEKIRRSSPGDDNDGELRERVSYLNGRIAELVSSMKQIAEQMPTLVEYRE